MQPRLRSTRASRQYPELCVLEMFRASKVPYGRTDSSICLGTETAGVRGTHARRTAFSYRAGGLKIGLMACVYGHNRLCCLEKFSDIIEKNISISPIEGHGAKTPCFFLSCSVLPASALISVFKYGKKCYTIISCKIVFLIIHGARKGPPYG